MKTSTLCLLTAFLPGLIVPAEVEAATIQVPNQHATIAEAALHAATGDTILVGPGRYVEHLVFEQGVVLMSTDGREATTLDGGESGRVIQGSGLEVIGFEITGGRARTNGGAWLGSGTMRDCEVWNNRTGRSYTSDDFDGGALAGSSFTVENCIFYSNYARDKGGAIAASVTVIDCQFYNNTAEFGAGGDIYGSAQIWNSSFAASRGKPGGSLALRSGSLLEGCDVSAAVNSVAVYVISASGVLIRNSIFRDNTLAPAIEINDNRGSVVIENCTFYNNRQGVRVIAGSQPAVVRNCVFLNHAEEAFCCLAGGTIETACNVTYDDGNNQCGCGSADYVDPLLCDPANGVFELRGSSPCMPINSGGCGWIGAVQISCEPVPVRPKSFGAFKGRHRIK